MVQIGKYQVIKQVGIGGMARALLARSPGGESVVLKVPLKKDDETLLRFEDEARAGIRLNHPCLVQTLDYFQYDGLPILVVSYIKGVSLVELWRQGPLSTLAVAEIARDLCGALSAIHNAEDDTGGSLQMVHRDVSPTNILVSKDGVSRLIDLGIVRSAEALHKTATGDLRGTVQYIAPELLQEEVHSPGSDLWALGIVLLECLIGEHVFAGSVSNILMQIMEFSAPQHSKWATFEPEFSRSLASLLIKDRGARIADAGHAEYLFQAFIDSHQENAGPSLKDLLNDREVDAFLGSEKTSDFLFLEDKQDLILQKEAERGEPQGVNAGQLSAGSQGQPMAAQPMPTIPISASPPAQVPTHAAMPAARPLHAPAANEEKPYVSIAEGEPVPKLVPLGESLDPSSAKQSNDPWTGTGPPQSQPGIRKPVRPGVTSADVTLELDTPSKINAGVGVDPVIKRVHDGTHYPTIKEKKRGKRVFTEEDKMRLPTVNEIGWAAVICLALYLGLNYVNPQSLSDSGSTVKQWVSESLASFFGTVSGEEFEVAPPKKPKPRSPAQGAPQSFAGQILGKVKGVAAEAEQKGRSLSRELSGNSPENAPSCFSTNDGFEFWWDDGSSNGRRAKRIQDIPKKKRGSATCLQIK
jgi:serine/threonine protein kinase